MPHLTVEIGPNGPLLNVLVGVSEPRAAALAAAGKAIPRLVAATALVDTGASHTCLDPSVIDQLGLTPTGRVEVIAPSSDEAPRLADQYDVSLAIPAAVGESPLILPNFPVFCSELSRSSAFAALIGRDILENCRLTYDGVTGVLTLAY